MVPALRVACVGSKKDGNEAAETSGEARSRVATDKNFIIAAKAPGRGGRVIDGL